MVCNKCGNPINPGATFCTNCGAPVEAQAPQTYNATPVYDAPQNYNPTPDAPPAKGLAIASLVLGIVSLFCLPVVTGVLAAIFGGVAKSKGNTSGMATAGIVLGIIGVATWLIMIIACGGFAFIPGLSY